VVKPAISESWLDGYYADTKKFVRYTGGGREGSPVPEQHADSGEMMYLSSAFIAEVDEFVTALNEFNEVFDGGFDAYKLRFLIHKLLHEVCGNDLDVWIRSYLRCSENIILEMGDVMWQAVHLMKKLERASLGEFGVKLHLTLLASDWMSQMDAYTTFSKHVIGSGADTAIDELLEKKLPEVFQEEPAISPESEARIQDTQPTFTFIDLIKVLKSLVVENEGFARELPSLIVGRGYLRAVSGLSAKTWLRANNTSMTITETERQQQLTYMAATVRDILTSVVSAYLSILTTIRVADAIFVGGGFVLPGEQPTELSNPKAGGLFAKMYHEYFKSDVRSMLVQTFTDPNATLELNIKKLEGRYKPM